MLASINISESKLIAFLTGEDFVVSFWSSFLSGLLLAGVLALLVYLFTDLFRASITILVHEAYPGNSDQQMYYVKITNVSSSKTFTVTHIYVEDRKEEIDVLNPDRPLPRKISPSEQWETWLPKATIEDKVGIFKNVRAVMSNGKVFKSRQNKNVRPVGFVAK